MSARAILAQLFESMNNCRFCAILTFVQWLALSTVVQWIWSTTRILYSNGVVIVSRKQSTTTTSHVPMYQVRAAIVMGGIGMKINRRKIFYFVNDLTVPPTHVLIADRTDLFITLRWLLRSRIVYSLFVVSHHGGVVMSRRVNNLWHLQQRVRWLIRIRNKRCTYLFIWWCLNQFNFAFGVNGDAADVSARIS